MATVTGIVESVDVEAARTTAHIRNGSNVIDVFVDTTSPGYSGDADNDAQVSTARKTALLLAAAWGVTVDVDVDANQVVSFVVMRKP